MRMIDFLKRHVHLLGGRIIFWNFFLFLIIKLVFPQSAFHLASLIDSIPVFDSREIIQLTNESRTANNLLPLQANIKLDLAASEKLNDMAIKEYFAHISPAGINPWFWIKKSEYKYSVAGENLAIGFFTAQDTVQAWLNSPSHRANILNNKYREIGVAAKAVEINGQNGILVVQMFGSSVIQTAQAGQPTKAPTPSAETPLALDSPITAIPTAQTRGESITIQYLSTDEVESVTEPTPVQFENAKNIINLSRILNNIFSAYFLIIGIISAAAFLLLERNKNMAIKMTLNVALFVLSVVIPVAKLSFEGLIF